MRPTGWERKDASGVFSLDVGTSMAYEKEHPPVSVSFTKLFERQVEAIWSEDETQRFIDFISRNPEAGDIIPGAGGARKVRWAARGSGKRGGARVIYCHLDLESPLLLIMIYAKSRKADLSPAAKRAVAELVAELKRDRRR